MLSQKQSRARASQGDVLCSVCVNASPGRSHGQRRGPAVKVLWKGEAGTPFTSLCKPLCSRLQHPLSPLTPGLVLLSYEAAEGNKVLVFCSVAASVIEHPPQHTDMNFMILGTKLLVVVNVTWKIKLR